MRPVSASVATLVLFLALPAPGSVPDRLFPAIPGWTLKEGEIVYGRGNLYDLIDGAADQFLSYGFIDLHTAAYGGEGDLEVRVEVYRHDSRNNAFGMYAAERSTGYKFIGMGTQGYIEDGVLNYLSGVFYVKLTTHQAGETGRKALRLVAEKVDSALKQEKGWPSTLRLLPAAGKDPNTEGYTAENFLGYSFLHSAFFADYLQPGRHRLFIIELKNPEEARAMAGAYMKYAGQKDASPGDGTYRVGDPNNGPVTILLKGRRLCGVLNYSDESTRDEALKNLEASLATEKKGK